MLTSTARRFPQTCQTPVGFLSSASRPSHHSINLLLGWPLWGVLLNSTASALLFEHGGEMFIGHSTTLLLWLIGLPIIAGFLTPEKPPYTALVFAVGCVPPLNDMPPVPIGLWPFLWIFRILSHGPRLAAWATASAQLPFELAFPAWGIAMMFIAYPPPVYLGWTIENDDPAANH